MIIARIDQGGTRTVGPVTGLDQPCTASTSAALHWVGKDMDEMYPARLQNGDQLGSAALDAAEGSRWL